MRQHLDKAQKDQSKAVPFDKRWNETKNKDLISSLLREYLLEELAVLLLWIRHPNEYHYNFTAYPRENNLAAQYLISKYLASASESNSAAPFCRELVYQFREIPKEDPFTVVNVTAGEARKRQKKGAEAELQAERKGDAIQKAKKKASKSEFTVFHGSSQALVGAVRNQSRIWDIVSSTNGNGSGKSPLPDEVGQDIEDILESLKSECKMLALKAKASLRHGLSPQADEALASLQHLRDALTRAGVEYASSESGSDGDSEEQKEKQGERGFSPGPAPGGSSGSGDS